MVCEQNTDFNLCSDHSFVRRKHLLLPTSTDIQLTYLTAWFPDRKVYYVFLSEFQICIRYAISGCFEKMRRDALWGNTMKLKRWVLCQYCFIWIQTQFFSSFLVIKKPVCVCVYVHILIFWRFKWTLCNSLCVWN